MRCEVRTRHPGVTQNVVIDARSVSVSGLRPLTPNPPCTQLDPEVTKTAKDYELQPGAESEQEGLARIRVPEAGYPSPSHSLTSETSLYSFVPHPKTCFLIPFSIGSSFRSNPRLHWGPTIM